MGLSTLRHKNFDVMRDFNSLPSFQGPPKKTKIFDDSSFFLQLTENVGRNITKPMLLNVNYSTTTHYTLQKHQIKSPSKIPIPYQNKVQSQFGSHWKKEPLRKYHLDCLKTSSNRIFTFPQELLLPSEKNSFPRICLKKLTLQLHFFNHRTIPTKVQFLHLKTIQCSGEVTPLTAAICIRSCQRSKYTETHIWKLHQILEFPVNLIRSTSWTSTQSEAENVFWNRKAWSPQHALRKIHAFVRSTRICPKFMLIW